jgi:hypothetical protein
MNENLPDQPIAPRLSKTILDMYRPKDHLSPSSYATFNRCPRKYFYKNCGLNLKDRNFNAATYGRAINDAMPFVFKQDLPGAIAKCREILEGVDLSGDVKRNPARLTSQLDHLIKFHHPSRSIYQPAFGCEASFDIPFVTDLGMKVPYVGIIDCIGRHKDTEKIWGVEYKTTSELGVRWAETFGLNSQIVSYWLGINALIDEEVEGFFVEGILIAKASTEVNCRPITLRPHMLDNYVQDVIKTQKRIEHCEASCEWDCRYCACSPYSMFTMPGYMCDYYWLCAMPDPMDCMDMFVVSAEREFDFDEYSKRKEKLHDIFTKGYDDETPHGDIPQ